MDVPYVTLPDLIDRYGIAIIEVMLKGNTRGRLIHRTIKMIAMKEYRKDRYRWQ